MTYSMVEEQPGDKRYVSLCLNRCGKVVESNELDDHLTNDCPLTVVDCDFKHVGCDVRLPRRDMSIHLEQAVIIHLSKQAESYEKRLKMLEGDNEKLALECTRLRSSLKELERKFERMFTNLGVLQKDTRTSLTSKPLTGGSGINRGLESDPPDIGAGNYVYQLKPTKSLVQTPGPMTKISRPSTPADLTMFNFEQHKRDNDHWISQPFFTHAQGYRMSLRVAANGQGCGKDTHISVEVYLTRGEFVDQLEWPFRGDISIQLLSQQENDSDHYTRTVYGATSDRENTTSDGSIISAWGFSKYRAHDELHPKYLKNDSLSFRIFTLLVKPSEHLETDV